MDVALSFSSVLSRLLRIIFVVAGFCCALFLGAIKGVLVGPFASVIVIIGNVAVILLLFPAHVFWTIYTIVMTPRCDAALKVSILLVLPALSGIWLGLSIAISVLVGVGYGFFTPWISTFEAFRQEGDSEKYFHCLVDGTWGTIKGSCTVVRDFFDLSYHSYPAYLQELRVPSQDERQTLRLIHVPGSIAVLILGLVVEIPLFSAIAIIKSPYLLFKGWQRLIHDLISREGPFLETACIPIAGLTILVWPLVVVGSLVMAIIASFFIGLYGFVVVYQERSFRRGVAYVIAMVAEFDEYTNDWLYLREGTMLPKPRYRKRKDSNSTEFSIRRSFSSQGKTRSIEMEAPAMLVPSLGPSRSVREAIQEVKVVQLWEHMMKCSHLRGKELLDANAITSVDLLEWLKSKDGNESDTIGVGLPSYSCFQSILYSIKAGSSGLLMPDGTEVTHLNRPHDRLLEWFFHPVWVLKEQIKVIKLDEGEIKYLEKLVLFGNDTQRMEAWENGGRAPQDAVRAAQIQGICRRMIGMVRSISKLPTYRRKYHQVVKALVVYALENEGSANIGSVRSTASSTSIETV